MKRVTARGTDRASVREIHAAILDLALAKAPVGADLLTILHRTATATDDVVHILTRSERTP